MFCDRSLCTHMSWIIEGGRLHGMNCTNLFMGNGERTALERKVSTRSTTIHFMSVVTPEVYLTKCSMVTGVCNWYTRPAIGLAMRSEHLPVLLAPNRKFSAMICWTISCSNHIRNEGARSSDSHSSSGSGLAFFQSHNADRR